jgi:hypothetical protein
MTADAFGPRASHRRTKTAVIDGRYNSLETRYNQSRPLKKLHRFLVLLRRSPSLERPQISPFPHLRIFFGEYNR